MKIEINKSDINEILWLQRAIEDVLINETLRRSIEDGINPSMERFLWQENIDYYNGIIEVSYVSRSHPYKRYSQTFSLAKVISLCLTE